MKALDRFEVWLVTGSQHLYGEEVLQQVAEQSRQVAAGLAAAAAIPVSVVHTPPVTSAESIHALLLEANASEQCVGLIAWMHTFSPAKMWIAGLRALQKPLLHLHTQFNRELPWAEIDMDFMNLNQSAHGDREFGYLATRMRLRRKTVAGHWTDPSVLERIGTWSRAACGWHEAQSLRVARFGDNMRQVAVTEGDKVEAQIRLGVSVNGYGVGELESAVGAVDDASVDRLVSEYEDAYELAPDAEGGRRAAGVAARCGANRSRLARVPRGRRLQGLHHHLRGSGRIAPAARHRRPAADGRRLRVRSGGRLENGGSRSRHEGDERRASRVAPRSWRTTPTTSRRATRRCSARTCSRCARRSAAASRAARSTRSRSGPASDPVRLVFTAAPGPAVVVALLDLGNRFRLVANDVEVVAPEEDLPRLPVARAIWRPKPSFATAAEGWLEAGGPHHTSFTQALTMEAISDLAEIAGIEIVVIDESTTVAGLKQELRWNHASYHLAGGL